MGYKYGSGIMKVLKNLKNSFSLKSVTTKFKGDENEDEPKPQSKISGIDESKKNQMKIVGGLLALLVVFIFASLSITGFVTYQDTLEEELNTTKANLSATNQELTECSENLLKEEGDLSSCITSLENTKSFHDSCKNDVANRDSQISSLNSDLSTCNSQKSSVENDLTASRDNFNKLAANSARASCCTVADLIQGTTQYWGISDNSVVCGSDKSYTVNCGSGSTSFP